ncbi:esterase [Plantactinospora sp. BC1]|uniref:alpha/beta fold hydrolase n=1 Tax=Plantactinospora sp. BC1 TaxID=2108470 RepID=UPI000D15E392|nr:alpha/beta fold hydrolase [Plantactinospora sp. BC1]AVT33520.1 esterase [Plantactinospora sp. BC1]
MRHRPLLLGRAGTALLGLLAVLAAGSPVAAAPPLSGPAALGNRPGLTDPRPCAEAAGFTCAELTVPLDRRGGTPGELRLRVAVAENADAPRGTLLLLSGGPGQPGPGLLSRLEPRFRYLMDDYRLVMIDQRGTGPAGIDCPQLQAEVGSSDITPASPEAIRGCAELLGRTRNFYTTADTVADLEELRRALGVHRWTLDGISYGTFVAQQYGLTYPHRVARMVLDSVVPQDTLDGLYLPSLHRVAWVLRTACREQSCGSDPAADVAETIRRYGNAVGIFDFLVIASIVDPKLTGETFYPVLPFLRMAAEGSPEPLMSAIDDLQGGENTPFAEYSSGLHAATVCADQTDAPWGDSTAPPGRRARALDRAVRQIRPGHVWPFPRETAAEQALISTCLHWPVSRPNPRPPRHTLTMPVLLLNGDRDLSTPVEWAVEQAARTPRGELVVIAGMGHSIQGRHPEGDSAVRRFLLGPTA